MCQLFTILQAALGFATFTVTLTYLLSVLNALTQRNVFALSLHHRMAGKANVARLLLGWGMDDEFTNTRSDITNISRDLFMLLESHHSYPILHYFRFSEPLYSLARMIYITMDTAALLQSALHQQHYRALINSTAVAELQTGGLYMLEKSKNSLDKADRWKGYGRSLLLQGAFLLSFDLILHQVHQKNTTQFTDFLSHLYLSPQQIGWVHTF